MEDVEALCSGDAVEGAEDAEAEESAVGLPEDVEVGGAAALRLKASAVEILVVVEAIRVFELVFGSPDCSPDLDSALVLPDPYSLLRWERELLLGTGSEIGGAADCQRAPGCDWAATPGLSEDDAKARRLRADSGYSQEVGWVFDHSELDENLALLLGAVSLLQADWGGPIRGQVEKRSVWGWVHCFWILPGQVPSSQVLRLLQHPRWPNFVCVPHHAGQIDQLLRLLCPSVVPLCVDDPLLHAGLASSHALPCEGLDPDQSEATHVRACGTHSLDGVRLSGFLAQGQYWPSRPRLYERLPSG